MRFFLVGNVQDVVSSDDLNKKHDVPHSFSGVVAMETDSPLPDQGMVLSEGKLTDGNSGPNNENELADGQSDPKNKSKLTDGYSVPRSGNGSKRKRIPAKRFLVKAVKDSPPLQGRTDSTSKGRRLNPCGKAPLQVLGELLLFRQS